uniref:glutamate racemase n=1 Tax=Thaumasiovibrio occultus TaxID=1891184 RepID=UPI000B356162|nr:glutamate racemase [Thaumasiovibrio occultus]
MRVLVFDSGVGGLSVLEEIRLQLPNADYYYAFDNEGFPYGELPADVLIHRVTTFVGQLARHCHADIVVIACNTASTIVLPPLRERLSIPVVGVVPAIKPAAAQSVNKCIGLLATPATVSRPYTQELIEQFASDCEVIRIGTTLLVRMAEDKLAGRKVDEQCLAEEVAAFKDKADTIVLGCTHFPLLKEELSRVLGKDVTMVDSGKAIANRVAALLDGFTIKEEGKLQAFCTKQTLETQRLQPSLSSLGFEPIVEWPIQ